MAHKQDMSLTAALIWITIFITMVVGWCMNIYQITQMYDAGITAKFVFKVIGVFAFPIGALLGFVN